MLCSAAGDSNVLIGMKCRMGGMALWLSRTIRGDYERFFDLAKRSLMSQAFLFTGDIQDPTTLSRRCSFEPGENGPGLADMRIHRAGRGGYFTIYN